jgi:hypothetical protein
MVTKRVAFGELSVQSRTIPATRVNAQPREIGHWAFRFYPPFSQEFPLTCEPSKEPPFRRETVRGAKATLKVATGAQKLRPKLSNSLVNNPRGVNKPVAFARRMQSSTECPQCASRSPHLCAGFAVGLFVADSHHRKDPKSRNKSRLEQSLWRLESFCATRFSPQSRIDQHTLRTLPNGLTYNHTPHGAGSGVAGG